MHIPESIHAKSKEREQIIGEEGGLAGPTKEAAGTNRQPCGATMWSVPLNFSPRFQQDKVRLVHDSWRSGRQRLGLADDRLRRCHANIARLGAPSGPGGDGSKHVDLIICFKNSLRASTNTQF